MPAENDSGPQNVAAAIVDVSERATRLVREEIELAKAEVFAKTGKLLRGIAVGAAAGFFAVIGALFLLHGLAWGLGEWLFDSPAWGYLALAGALFALAGVAGVLAARAVKAAAPPTPSAAIDEARKIKQTISSPSDRAR